MDYVGFSSVSPSNSVLKVQGPCPSRTLLAIQLAGAVLDGETAFHLDDLRSLQSCDSLTDVDRLHPLGLVGLVVLDLVGRVTD